MFCQKCGAKNDDNGQFCSGCGEALRGTNPKNGASDASRAPSAQKERKVGILLGVGILFLPYIFSWFTLRKGHSTLARALSLGWCGFVILSFAMHDGNKKSAATNTTASLATPAAQHAVAAPAPPEQVAFIAEPCHKLTRKFGPGSKLSDLQKEEQWKKYKGKAFKWKLKVTEVSSDMFGGFTVQYKCGSRSPSLIQDIQVKYGENRKGVVMQLEKGSVYEINGILNNQSTLLGLTADDLN